MTVAPREIVVGYDDSDHARHALEVACRLAGEGTRITVVHAYRVPAEVRSYEFFEDLLEAYRKIAEEVLDVARGLVGERTPAADYVAAERSAAEAVLAVARERDADLIVVGSRGTGLLRAALGSVTLRILHGATCPVLVVPAAANEP